MTAAFSFHDPVLRIQDPCPQQSPSASTVQRSKDLEEGDCVHVAHVRRRHGRTLALDFVGVSAFV